MTNVKFNARLVGVGSHIETHLPMPGQENIIGFPGAWESEPPDVKSLCRLNVSPMHVVKSNPTCPDCLDLFTQELMGGLDPENEGKYFCPRHQVWLALTELCPGCLAEDGIDPQWESEMDPDLDDDFPEPEPTAWHRSEITELGNGKYLVNEATNDDRDCGYPTEYAHWQLTFDSLESALKHTGKSRQGIGCEVIVTLNGQRI